MSESEAMYNWWLFERFLRVLYSLVGLVVAYIFLSLGHVLLNLEHGQQQDNGDGFRTPLMTPPRLLFKTLLELPRIQDELELLEYEEEISATRRQNFERDNGTSGREFDLATLRTPSGSPHPVGTSLDSTPRTRTKEELAD
ncbi:unnamed protein product [Orchesella dallaii]|uniref:Uncharacterized protein n=1 Tax=Orchesella dallaii TaxID=48710 RepID=A0ABP1RD18_9HEXA